jgi:hypothetical protein
MKVIAHNTNRQAAKDLSEHLLTMSPVYTPQRGKREVLVCSISQTCLMQLHGGRGMRGLDAILHILSGQLLWAAHTLAVVVSRFASFSARDQSDHRRRTRPIKFGPQCG